MDDKASDRVPRWCTTAAADFIDAIDYMQDSGLPVESISLFISLVECIFVRATLPCRGTIKNELERMFRVCGQEIFEDVDDYIYAVKEQEDVGQ